MLNGLDLVVFLALLAAVMGTGLAAGRRTSTAEEYFLAGRELRWWWVAGSMFGTNVSANHLVGMLGVGFSIGFAQSHFEIGAVFALLALAYGLLPVYAKLRVFTLSEYLGSRYDERVALIYSVTNLLLITVQLTALFYIGSRSMTLLLRESAFAPGYVGSVWIMAAITCLYTLLGGLRAVVWTDAIQSVLLLIAGIIVAIATFSQPEIGGWSGLLALEDALPESERRMRLYLPSNDPDLPWTGVFTGLMIMHLSFWGTNQTIVQRALAARDLAEARRGILAGGLLKLSVPFFSIAGGVAAAHLFRARLADPAVAPDEAFPVLMALVLPAGLGLMGWVAAGLLGAILSTIDSNLNSASTLACVDLYRKHLRPDATEAEQVRFGRLVVVGLVTLAAALAATTYDPNSRGNFFLEVSRRISYLTPGLLVAFVMGMLSARATARGAIAAVVAAPLLSVGFDWGYELLAVSDSVASMFGEHLNFMHRTFLVAVSCVGVQFGVDRSRSDAVPAKDAAPWSAAGQHRGTLEAIALRAGIYVAGCLGLGVAATSSTLDSAAAGALGALFSVSLFAEYVMRERRAGTSDRSFLVDDRLLAGALVGGATFVLLYFA